MDAFDIAGTHNALNAASKLDKISLIVSTRSWVKELHWVSGGKQSLCFRFGIESSILPGHVLLNTVVAEKPDSLPPQ